MTKLPSFQFYPGDWMKDPGLRACTLEEKGAWIEMLALMFECTPRGKLVLNGKPYPEDALARLFGVECKKFKQITNKLQALGVLKVEPETGIMYCRRMVKDQELREVRAEAGKQGGAPKGNKNASKKQAKTTPSSSSSTSVTVSNDTGAAAPTIWDLWVSVAGEKSRSYLGRLISEHGEERVTEAVASTIAKRPADPVSYIAGILTPKKREVVV